MYRETLVDALRRLRPQVELSDVEQDALDAEIERFHPHLVVCSRACAEPRNGTLTWVTLYPGSENLAEITTTSGRATIVGVQFDHLLSIIDGTEFLRKYERRE